MKTMLKVISLAAVLAASAPLAMADAINVGVAVNGTATVVFSPDSITLASPGNVGAIGYGTTPTPSSPSTAGFFSAGLGTVTFNTTQLNTGTRGVQTVISGSPTSGGLFIGSIDQNGEILSFFATTETPSVDSLGLHIGGSGYFTEVCDGVCGAGNKNYDATAANFVLNASTTGQFSTFQATTATVSPVPEPSSLALLGTGLLGAVGAARRKFKV